LEKIISTSRFLAGQNNPLSSETELITQCHCVSVALAIWNEVK